MSGSLPAHASPALPPHHSPPQADDDDAAADRPRPSRNVSDLQLDPAANGRHDESPQPPPPSIISPAFTPPSTPGGRTTPALSREAASVPVNHDRDRDHDRGDAARTTTAAAAAATERPALVETLPEVSCVVRARIPTTTGQEMFLHVYTNSLDSKEHLAIVFGNSIRSRSLDGARPGETERDRMIRGAYVGRLYPGRTSSRVEQLKLEEGGGGVAAGGEPAAKSPLVRIHSECYTGETVWSARCDCGEQLDEAARLMSLPNSGGGVIVYLRQEGRGIGLAEKLKAYNLQDLGNDTYEANLLLRHPADARSYGLATAMLVDLGLGGDTGIRLLTNNPDKVAAVEGPNREVVVNERVAMVPLAWKKGQKGSEEVEKYLSTKIEKFKHMLSPDSS